MAANLRKQAQQYVGKPVTVRHKNGTMYHGILQSVHSNGVRIRPFQGQQVANPGQDVQVENAIGDAQETVEAENVFFPVWPVTFLITFALIAGLYGWGAYGGYGYGARGGYGYGYGAGGGYGAYGYGRRGFFW